MPEGKSLVMEAMEDISLVIKRLKRLNLDEVDIDDKILDNRVITLEGYLRFMDRDGIPELKKIVARLEGDSYD